MTAYPLRLPQQPQPSHWFPVLALGRFTMVIEKQSRKNTTGRDGGDEVMFVGYSTVTKQAFQAFFYFFFLHIFPFVSLSFFDIFICKRITLFFCSLIFFKIKSQKYFLEIFGALNSNSSIFYMMYYICCQNSFYELSQKLSCEAGVLVETTVLV